MERNPIYATLFTGGMAAYAATFESSYELLPAANIAGPDCSGMSQRYANKLRVDIGTGTNPPLYLNDVRKWEQLGLPAELPPEMSRQHFLELAEERLEAASQIVCELNSYSIPARIALKMNFVIGELAEPGGDRNIIDSTWDTIELDARPGRTITHSGSHAKGDGTVPYWSAEPEAVNSKTILNLPHATEFEHAELLDDAHVVSHLQRIVDRAATDVAWLTAEPLGRPISTVAEWEETRQELVNYGLEKTSPEIVAAAIGTLSANAELLDISGLDLYRDARKYNGDSELAYKAVGFTVAAAIESGLNDRSVLWANQNSSYYWLKAGNTNMSVETALRTGKLASDFYNEGDPDPDLSKVELNSIEKKWRGVLLSERVEATDPDIIGVIADFENYDPNLFDQAKGLGYGNLEYRNPYLFVSPPT